MSLILDENQAQFQIRAYQPGFIQVNETVYKQSIIITAQKLITDWPPQHISELNATHFDEILKLFPTILLIGTGEKLEFPPVATYGQLINAGIGVEVMNTSAACRTYSALTAENRDVAAALILS